MVNPNPNRRKNIKPGLTVPSGLNPELEKFLQSVKEHLQGADGTRGQPKERFVTLEDLERAGLIKAGVKNGRGVIMEALATQGESGSSGSDVTESFNTTAARTGDVLKFRSPNQWVPYEFFDPSDTLLARRDRLPDELTYSDEAETITAEWEFSALVTIDHDGSGPHMELAGAAPRMLFNESAASTDRKLVDVIYDSATLSFRTRTDANGAGLTFLRMSRGSGTAVSNVHVGVPSTWGLFAQPTSSSITGTNHGTTFSSGGLSQSATAVGSQVGLSFSNVDGTDGARSFISLSVDGGAQGVTWMTMPTANTTSYLTDGPASGAYSIITAGLGPISIGIGNTEYIRFSTTFNHWRVPNYFAPGTAGAPGISFLTTVAGATPTADSDTGFYRIGADNLGLSLGGTLRVDYSTTRALFSIRIDTLASASGGAGLRLPHGAAPSAPTDGDIWTTTAGLFVRINGTTVGPLS